MDTEIREFEARLDQLDKKLREGLEQLYILFVGGNPSELSDSEILEALETMRRALKD